MLWSDAPLETDRLRQEMDRLVAQVVGGGRQANGGGRQILRPAASVSEDEDAYRVSVDLPGVTEEGLDVEVHDRTLSVRAVRDEARAYERVLQISDDIDTERIAADLSHGVLELTLPKREQAKPRRVEIGAGRERAEITAEAT